MKVGKKLLSVLLAIVMIMSSMSVCFGSLSFTASAAISDDTISQLKEALQSDLVTKAGNTDNTDGVKVTTSYGSGTGDIVNTVTIETSTYAAYVSLKDIVILMDKAIKETNEWKNKDNTDDVKNPGRACTSTYHIEVELLDSLESNGLALTEPIKKFIQYFLRSSGAVLHENAENYRNSARLGNPSATHSSVPNSYANTVIVKTTDYKGYLATRGAYTNVESTITLGYTYTLKMWELFYAYSGSGFLASKYRCIHNMFYNSKGGFDAPSVYTPANKTGVDTELKNHVSVINTFTAVSFEDLLAKVSDGTIDTYLSDFNTAVANAKNYVGGEATYNKLFSSFAADVANQMSSIQSAKDMQKYIPIADSYEDFVANNPDYGRFNWGEGGGVNNWGIFGEKGSATHAQMEADYLTFKGYYDSIVAGGTKVLDYFVNSGKIDMQYLYNFTDNYNVYYLNDSRNAADEFYNTYKDTYKDYTTEEQVALLSQVTGFINAIPSYRSNVRGGELEVINAIYNEGYGYLLDLQEELKVEVNEFVLYFAENAHKSYVDLKTKAVWGKIDEAIAKRSGLEAFYNTLSSARRDQLLGQIRTSANEMIAGLYKLLGDRFTAEVDAAYALYTELGKPSTVTVETFLKLNAVLLGIEADIMADLDGRNQGGYITAATRAKYEEMKVSIIPVCDAFRTTYGFNSYKQSYIADKDTGIYPEDRGVYADDEVKTQPYIVDKAKMNALIDALDKIINSDLVGGLLGGLLGVEEGEEFNLGDALTDLIKGALFTDDFINTVVQLLYPLVLGEFEDVFADLPSTVDVTDPIKTTVDVFYEKTLWNVLNETGFALYPDLMANTLASKYQDNIDKLKAAKQNWESIAIRDPETKKLTLEWGVAEQKEKLDAGEITMEEFETFFYNAFEDATKGILPLLSALITNVEWKPNNVSRIAYAEKNILIYNVQLQVDLQLGATPNDGYSNLLIPIYEALGLTSSEYTAASSVRGSTDIAYVLETILAPIFTFLGKLGDAPVETILSILPNLIYSTAFNMVPALLNMLQTTVTYQANEVSLGVGTVLNGGADVFVGDMLITDDEGALLPKSMFTGGLKTILANFGIEIPTLDQATLATLGKLDKINTTRGAYIYSGLEGTGKAYSITADKADVGYYLLQYILGAVKDEAALTSLLGLFMVQKDENGEPILNAAGEKIPDEEAMAGIKEVIYETLNLDEMNVGNVIAAIVELANQVEYDVGEYYWYDGSKSTPIGTTSATEIYLNPGNDWTEAKAEYLYDNLEGLLNSIFTMAGLDISVEGALADAIGGLFSNKTVTGLAKLLGSLSDLGALLAPKAEEDAPEASEPETAAEGEEATEEAAGLDFAEILTDLLKNELGIDLSVYAQYANIGEEEVVDFGVTDAASFVAALTELLKPLKPVLDFILAGKDLTLIDSAITLHGYKGYDNAIIPLLEALGAAPVAYTDGADTLALTLSGLVGVINKLTTNDPAVEKDGAIYTIIDILPGVLYYISSNALSQGIDKLLTPVYAILDTIRPIYNLKLNDLLAGIEIGEEGAKKPLGLDIKNITWSFIFGLLNDLLGLDLSALAQVIYDVAKDIGVEYDSVSTLESTWKKGAYSTTFSQADMLTVVLSFVLEWITVPANGAKLDEMLGTDGIVASIGKVFEDVKITYGTPNWMYWFESEDAFNEYLAGNTNIPNTLASLEYPDGNDWDLDTAKYFAENIDVLVDKIIAMINEGKTDDEGNALPTTLADLLSGLVNGLVNAETLNDLVGMITGLLGDIDENLINAAGYLLDVDLAGLKNYTCTADIDSISDFINELANVLDKYAGGLVNWLFFGDDYRFAKKSDNTDTIVINGGLGYEKGLAMILEALGCELPEEANTKSVLGALATRVDEILADPINEVLDLLPNLVYFLNANGAGVAVDNLLGPVNALLDKINDLGLLENEIDLNALLTIKVKDENGNEVEKAILQNLKLANVVEIVEGATGLPLDAAEAILVNFCTGKITKGQFGYKMAAAREDVITILLVVALELISNDAFAAKLDEMLGTDFIAKIKGIFAPSEIEYAVPDWNYAAADNGTVDAMKYSITYPNNWTEKTAKYVTELLLSDEFDALIASLIEDGKYATISELLKDKVNIFTTDTLNSLLDMIKNLLGGIDESLLELGFILDVDLNGLMAYEVTEDINDVKAFAAELSTILGTYAPGVVEWLLLGRDFKLLVKDADGIGEGLEGDPYITISGAEGYKKGLAILLEALGCENLPSPVITEENTTAKIIEGVLTSLAARIDDILSNDVDENGKVTKTVISKVLELLPNLFYFLNTNGVAAVIKNTTAALTALSAKINVFVDVNLDVASMVNLKELLKLPEEAKLSMTNLSMAAVLEAVGMLVGLDLTKAEKVLVDFALGKFEAYTSVSGDADAKKMVYADEFDKHDLVTVVANLALLVLADEANAEFVKGLVGEEVYDVILNVLQIKEAELKKMSWQHTDKVGESFNAMTSSENYKGYGYGPRYTEEMADYIAENIGEFVDNIIYLLGIEIEGKSVESLEEILKNLVNGNLYNSANIVAIRDALAGLLDKIAGLEVNGVVVGGYIVDVLKTSLGVDVAAVAKVEVPEFTEDKEQFITYLGKVVEPLGPVLNWILTDEDIAFFAKEGEDGKPTDFIKLPGNAGYKNGIVLLLEALGCKGIVAPADLEGASGSAIVTAIAEPLLNRLDEIINKPAEELLAVLPNLIYFINSNGVDVVVKNTLNAVYTILNAIEPIAKIDLYELIGLDLETLTFEKLIDMLLKDLEIAGFKFTEIPMDTFVELTVGKLETYDSLSAEDPAYRMVYDENSASKGDMVTVLLRLVITFILTENNREVLINLLKSELGMSADAEKYVAALFKALADCTIGNQLGMDSALATIYYVYYGLDKGVGETADGKKDLDKAWQAKLKELGYSDNKDEQSVGNLITDILDIVFNDQGNVPDDGGNDVLDKDGLASNGFLAFFARIKAFFEEIAAFFRELFSFGK